MLPFVNMSDDAAAGILLRRNQRGHHHRARQGYAGSIVVARNSSFIVQGDRPVQLEDRSARNSALGYGGRQRAQGRACTALPYNSATSRRVASYGRNDTTANWPRYCDAGRHHKCDCWQRSSRSSTPRKIFARSASPPTASTLGIWSCELWHFWRVTRADNRASQKLLEQTIAIDPNYAQALAMLAVSHAFGASMGLGGRCKRRTASRRALLPCGCAGGR